MCSRFVSNPRRTPCRDVYSYTVYCTNELFLTLVELELASWRWETNDVCKSGWRNGKNEEDRASERARLCEAMGGQPKHVDVDASSAVQG